MEKSQLLYAEIRTPNMASDRSADVHLDPEKDECAISMTKQSFAQECDINYILQNNAFVAPLTPEQYAALNFVDLGDSTDYHSAKNYLIEANNSFMSLDATIRARFDNDPGKFLDFVQDPANADEMYRMGLAVRAASQTVSEPSEPAPKGKALKPAPELSEEA